MTTQNSDKGIVISYGPFKGINKLVDRTALGQGQLTEAKGVYHTERGRLRCMHEGSAVDTVGGTDNVFYGLNDETNITKPPEKIVNWRAAGVLVAINDYVVCLSNDNDPAADFQGYLLRQPYPIQEWTASTLYKSGEIVRPTSANWNGYVFKAHRELQSGGSAASRYKSGSSEPDWSTVTQVGDTVDDELSGGFQLTWLAEREVSQQAYAVEFEDFLIVCVDGEPARAYHPDNLTNDDLIVYADNNSTATHDWFDHSISLPYYPILMYRSWYNTGTVNLVDSGSAHNVTLTTGDFRASGAVTNGYSIIASPGGHIFRRGTFDISAYPKRGAVWYVSSSTAARLDYADIYTAGDPGDQQNDAFYRVGIPGQSAMYRHPAVYNGRFCAVEGRKYEFSNLGQDSAVLAAGTAGNDYITIAGVDLTGSISKGDNLVLYRDDRQPGGHSVGIHDYNLSTYESWTVDIADVVLNGSDTEIYLTETLKSTMANIAWCTRRLLEPYERRRIYFTGRPADVDNGISADGRDFLWIETGNNVIVGESFEGDITALFPQNEYRLIVGMDAALYEIVGDLPLDGTPPANFDVRRIASGVGVRKDTAITISDDGQVVYFCSPTDNGVYRLYGNVVERIDEEVREHSNYSGEFNVLSLSNKLLYCHDGTYIWCLDLISGAWTYTERVNSGQDATGTLAALELSDGSYASNNLYPTDDAGVFAPYRDDPTEDDRAVVAYLDTNFKLRTLNYEDHNYANLSHGVKVTTQFSDFGTVTPGKVREARVASTVPLLDDAGGSAFSEIQITASDSEGQNSLSQDVTPVRTVANKLDYYRAAGSGGRGAYSVAVTVGDGISAVGEISEIEATIKPMPGRSRG